MPNSARSITDSSQLHSLSLSALVSPRANSAKSRRVPLRCCACQSCSLKIKSCRASARCTGSTSRESMVGESVLLSNACSKERIPCQRCASSSLSRRPSAVRSCGRCCSSMCCGHHSLCFRCSITAAQPARSSQFSKSCAICTWVLPASLRNVSHLLFPPRRTQRANSSRHSPGRVSSDCGEPGIEHRRF